MGKESRVSIAAGWSKNILCQLSAVPILEVASAAIQHEHLHRLLNTRDLRRLEEVRAERANGNLRTCVLGLELVLRLCLQQAPLLATAAYCTEDLISAERREECATQGKDHINCIGKLKRSRAASGN